MSMASGMSTASRRIPQQERAERRVEKLLDSAAEVIAANGYEAATMTEIAARAGASIGAVYQYFPNKEAIVRALRAKYGDELEQRWTLLDEALGEMPLEQLVSHLVDGIVQFTEEHPAYFPLRDAPVSYKRDQSARDRLRERFANVFRRRNRSLLPEEALRIANVALQIVKSMTVLYADAKARERQELVREYKVVLLRYLESRLAE